MLLNLYIVTSATKLTLQNILHAKVQVARNHYIDLHLNLYFKVKVVSICILCTTLLLNTTMLCRCLNKILICFQTLCIHLFIELVTSTQIFLFIPSRFKRFLTIASKNVCFDTASVRLQIRAQLFLAQYL